MLNIIKPPVGTVQKLVFLLIYGMEKNVKECVSLASILNLVKKRVNNFERQPLMLLNSEAGLKADDCLTNYYRQRRNTLAYSGDETRANKNVAWDWLLAEIVQPTFK